MVRPYEPVDVGRVIARADEIRPRSKQTALARAEGKWGVGPSDIGECRARIGYRERPPADYVPLPEDKSAAYIGTLIHDGIRRTLKARRRNVWTEMVVHVPGFDVPGHLDIHEPRIQRTTDIKTCGEWKWERISLGPVDEDFDQVQMYALALAARGIEVKTVRIVYVRRATGETEPFERPYDEQAALAAAGWLHNVIDTLDYGGELPRDRNGPDLDGVCARCPARAHCWDLDAAAEAGRTPYGYKYVVDDPEIEQALEDYDEYRSEETDAKGRKALVRDALTGIDSGRYGDMELGWQRSTTTQVQDDLKWAAALEAEILVARAEGRPPRSPREIPVPTKTKTTGGGIQVKRVRAATLAAEGREVASVGAAGGDER